MTIQPNDTVYFDIPVKLKDQSQLGRAGVSMWDFRNWERTYLNLYLVDENGIAAKNIDKNLLLTYLSEGGVEGGQFWDYAQQLETMMNELPTTDKIFRFAKTGGGPEEGLITNLQQGEVHDYYAIDSITPGFAKYHLTSNLYYILLNGSNNPSDDNEATNIIKILGRHGHTVNETGLNNGYYTYQMVNGGIVLSNLPENYERQPGSSLLYIQVIPALVLTEKTHIVDINSTDWSVKELLTQFSDPKVVKRPIALDDPNQWINDDSKVAGLQLEVKNLTTNEVLDAADIAKLKQKVGRYEVKATYNFGSEDRPLLISNIGYVNVVAHTQQEVQVRVFDDTVSSDQYEVKATFKGESNSPITDEITNSVEQLISEYEANGYKLESTTEIGETFDSTNNFTMEDSEIQYLDLHFTHTQVTKTESAPAKQLISYVGAGDETPEAITRNVYNVFTRDVVIDGVTKEIISSSDWVGSHTFESVVTPMVSGYEADIKEVASQTLTAPQENNEIVVTYTKLQSPQVKESPLTGNNDHGIYLLAIASVALLLLRKSMNK